MCFVLQGKVKVAFKKNPQKWSEIFNGNLMKIVIVALME